MDIEEECWLKSNLIDSTDAFDCIICFNIAKSPLECLSCGQNYCKKCQDSWKQGNGCYMCLKCEGTKMQNLNAHLLEGYNELKYKCTCGTVTTLKELPLHESYCKQPNCKYFAYCGKKVIENFKDKKLCSTGCLIFELCQQQPLHQKQLFNNIMTIFKKKQQQEIIRQPSATNLVANSVPSFPLHLIKQRSSSMAFKWDLRPNFRGENITIKNNGMTVFLKESFYIFKSVVADIPFESGKHYFEIELNACTENELKIGVVTNNTFNKQSAFCDLEDGFAFYTIGKLRSGSNTQGNQYGIQFKNAGVCGVYLDMNKGLLAFGYNGKGFGVAFSNQKLTKAPIYASVSLLHCAGFNLKSGLAPPPWADNL